MDRDEILAGPARFWIGEARWDLPVAVIDLDRGEEWPDELALPPCPLIGIGSRDAPGAAHVDTVIEPPASLDGVVSRIEACPRAAGVIVGLLRLLPSLDPLQGLAAESLAYATLQGSEEHLAWRASRPNSVCRPPQ